MKTRTLQDIKTEVAFKHNGMPWESLSELGQLNLWPEVCRRAQLEACRATLDKLSIKGDEFVTGDFGEHDLISFKGGKKAVISKSNIVIIE